MDSYTCGHQKQSEIEAGLLALLVRTPFSKITVADLSKHLGISRKCFYHYFPNKEACLESLMDRVIREAAIYVAEGLENRTSVLQGYVLNLEYWKSQRQFLDILEENHLEIAFSYRCMIHNLREEKHVPALMETEEVSFDEDILYFCISGQLGFLLNWHHQGFPGTVEEMAAKLYRLLRMPLINKDH